LLAANRRYDFVVVKVNLQVVQIGIIIFFLLWPFCLFVTVSVVL